MSENNRVIPDIDCASVNKKGLAFWGLLLLGTGFAIGGVFIAPLFAVSIGCFGGAIGISHTMGDEEQISVSIPPNMPKGVKIDLNIQAYRRGSRKVEVNELSGASVDDAKQLEITSVPAVSTQYNDSRSAIEKFDALQDPFNIKKDVKESHFKLS
jgi:hypothetical protein